MAYKRKVSIRFYARKDGKRCAQWFVGMQWRQVSVVIANAMIANGDAELIERHRLTA